MRYGQSGSDCKVILVKVACDNKIVTNTLSYVLVKEITENTPPPPLQKKRKEKKKSLHSNPRDSEVVAAFSMHKIDLHERMS